MAGIDNQDALACRAAQRVEEHQPRQQRVASLASLDGDDVAALHVTWHEVVVAFRIGDAVRRQKNHDRVLRASLFDKVQRGQHRVAVGLDCLAVRKHFEKRVLVIAGRLALERRSNRFGVLCREREIQIFGKIRERIDADGEHVQISLNRHRTSVGRKVDVGLRNAHRHAVEGLDPDLVRLSRQIDFDRT